MRPRSVIALRIRAADGRTSVMEVTTSDGRERSTRVSEATHATIAHAARCLSDHYGLVELEAGSWVMDNSSSSRRMTP